MCVSVCADLGADVRTAVCHNVTAPVLPGAVPSEKAEAEPSYRALVLVVLSCVSVSVPLEAV
jgi:hypothetical protein